MTRILIRLGLVSPPPPPPPPPPRTYFRIDTTSVESLAMYAAAFRLVNDMLRAGK